MKRVIAFVTSIILTVALGACGLSSSDSQSVMGIDATGAGEVYMFKMDIPDPPDSIVGSFLYEWAAQVNEASKGRINITIYPNSQLGAITDIIDNLKRGVSDIAWATPAMFPGRFPITEGTNLPMLDIPDHTVGTDMLNELYSSTDFMQKEYEGIHILSLHMAAPYYFAADEGKTIQNISDIKGMKIRAQGTYPSELLSELGAEPVSLHARDLYDSLSNDLIDGHLSDASVYNTWKVNEVTGHVIETPIYRFSAFLLMNPNAYNSLPDDLRAILDEQSSKEILAYGLGQAFEEGALNGLDFYKDEGGSTSTLSDADLELIKEASEKVNAKWIKDMDAAGYDGRAVFDRYSEILAKLNKSNF